MAHGLSCSVACGIFPDQDLSKPVSPALASGFFTTESPRKPHQEKNIYILFIFVCVCVSIFMFYSYQGIGLYLSRSETCDPTSDSDR